MVHRQRKGVAYYGAAYLYIWLIRPCSPAGVNGIFKEITKEHAKLWLRDIYFLRQPYIR